MLLCLLLFDDAALRKILPQRLIRLDAGAGRARVRRDARYDHRRRRWRCCSCSAAWCRWMSVSAATRRRSRRRVDRLIEPLHIVSAYGLFAVMTTQRNEIVIEGSDDGVNWREYEFRYKPGDVTRRPRWNIPHQPRLDWQMWFAALDDPRRLPWFQRFLQTAAGK